MTKKPYEMRHIEQLVKFGKDIREHYIPSDVINPVMIPPAPNLSPYIDRYDEKLGMSESNKSDQLRQRDYQAEVQVYRALEKLKKKILVLHSFEYTHGHYSLFVGDHSVLTSGKKCSMKDKEIEGECDFVVLGPDYVVVIEVKNVFIDCNATNEVICETFQALTSTFNKSLDQRRKTVVLIKSILGTNGAGISIHQYSVYPNLNKIFKSKFNIKDDLLSTIIFKEDLETFNCFWEMNIQKKHELLRHSSKMSNLVISVKSILTSVQNNLHSEFFILLTIGSIIFAGQFTSSIISWYSAKQTISDDKIDKQGDHSEILDQAKDILISLWCFKKNKCNKDRSSLGWTIAQIDDQLRLGKFTFRSKKRDFNPGVIEAPKIVRDCIGISNLTKEQWQVLNSDQQLLWINGPAGSGKTVILLSKLMKITQDDKQAKVVMIKFGGKGNNSQYQYSIVLNKANITCNCIETYVAKHEAASLINQISMNSNVQVCVVIVTGSSYLAWLTDIIRLLSNYHIFIDDVHSKLWMNGVRRYTDFIETLKQLSLTNTVWLACDLMQGFDATGLATNHIQEFAKLLSQNLSTNHFMTLSTNMRNSYDLSNILSEIRNQYIQSDFSTSALFEFLLPKQYSGHFIHGPKTIFHVLNNFSISTLSHLVNQEIQNLLMDKNLRPDEIAILYPTLNDNFKSELEKNLNDTIFSVFKYDTCISFCSGQHSSSAEWPAVIVLHKMIGDFEMQLTWLYQTISRARVFCSVILYPSDGEKVNDNKLFVKLLPKISNFADIELYHCN